MTLLRRSSLPRGTVPAAVSMAAAIVCALAHAAVFAQTAKTEPGPPYTVKSRTYKAGDVSRYRLTAKVVSSGPMGDQNVVVQLKFSETVQTVKPSGEWSLVQVFESGAAAIGGQEQDVLAVLPVVILTRDSEGKVTVKTMGGTADGAVELGGILLQVSTAVRDFAPDKAVKPGDKWQVSFANPNKLIGGSKVEAEAELLNTETIAGIKTLKIRFKGTTREGADGEKSPIEGTINIEPDSGRLIRITEKGPGAFAGGKAKSDIEVTLAPYEPKPPKP